MKTALTINEAIAEGFKYCVKDDEWENLILVSEVNFDDYEGEDVSLQLCNKEPSYHSISEEQISNLIVEHLDAQEEYYAEDGFPDSLNGCNDLIAALATTINQNLRKHKFYMPSDIQLIPNS